MGSGSRSSRASVPNPTRPARIWGGSQDNGTERKPLVSMNGSISSVATVARCWSTRPTGITSTARISASRRTATIPRRRRLFFSNSYIRNGINLNDRAEFYVPWVMNKDNPNQLFLGTYRLYRTDNAKATRAADVIWKPISGDLTSGCTGPAPNGGRGCTISAIGIGGGDAIYTGSEEGYVYVSPDAQTSDNPSWTQRRQFASPARPVTSFAVDRSNYRIAYVAFAGLQRGHVRPAGARLQDH